MTILNDNSIRSIREWGDQDNGNPFRSLGLDMQSLSQFKAFPKWMVLATSALFSVAAFACKPTAISEPEFEANSSSLEIKEIKKVILLGEEIRFHPIGVVALTAFTNQKTPPELAKRRLEFVKNLLVNIGVPVNYIHEDIKPPYASNLINSIYIEAEYMPPDACTPPLLSK